MFTRVKPKKIVLQLAAHFKHSKSENLWKTISNICLRLGPNWNTFWDYTTFTARIIFEDNLAFLEKSDTMKDTFLIFLKIFFPSLANQFSTRLYHFSKVLNKNYCFVCNALNYSLKYYYHVCYKKRKVALLSLKNQQRSWEWCHFRFCIFPQSWWKNVYTLKVS